MTRWPLESCGEEHQGDSLRLREHALLQLGALLLLSRRYSIETIDVPSNSWSISRLSAASA